jgi:uncharacterized protein YbaR (Trm112 family)
MALKMLVLPPVSKELSMTAIDKTLLDLLVCPLTRSPLVYDEAKQELISKEAKLAYPIREGIPVMLVEEARKLEQ